MPARFPLLDALGPDEDRAHRRRRPGHLRAARVHAPAPGFRGRLRRRRRTGAAGGAGYPARPRAPRLDAPEASRADRQQAVSALLADAESPRECVPRVLETIARGLGWSIGGLWQIRPGADRLRLAGWWADPDGDFSAFAEASEATEFPQGVGLPGRVWA